MPEANESNGETTGANFGEKPVVGFDYKDNVMELSYTFPQFTLSDDQKEKDDHEVGISGAGFFSESGKPLLPSFGRFIQIPPDGDFTIELEKGEPEVFENVNIRPARENAKDQEAWVVEYDAETYGKDKFYPYKIVECSDPLYMDGYRVVCVHVRPLQFNPMGRTLLFYRYIKVLVNLEPEERSTESDVNKEGLNKWVFRDRSRNLQGFGNFLFNPGRAFFAKWPATPPRADRPHEKPGGPEFLIIYGRAFKKPARKLREWKKKRGIETEITPIGKIVDPCENDLDKVKKLKAYLREKRGVPFSPLRYVLLFADVDEIPAEEINRKSCKHTDYYYYTHRDAKEAECLLPWISGGRIPVRNETEGLSVVDKIIRYEKKPPTDPEYYRRMAFSAYFEDVDNVGDKDQKDNKAYIKTMEHIREHMISQGFQVNRVYVCGKFVTPSMYCDNTPVPRNVKEIIGKDKTVATKRLLGLINEGQLIVGHRDHGKKYGWEHPPFTIDHLKSIQTDNPSVFFSINCSTGSFYRNEQSFAEDLLALHGGAPSLIASTEMSGAWRNDSMIKALFDAIWPGVIPTFPITTRRHPVKYYRIGDILTYAKAYILAAHGLGGGARDHLEIYHVVGDPTLQIWGNEPLTLRLRVSILKDILVINMNTCPRDAVLSVWHGGTRLMRMEPAGARLSIPLSLFDKLPEGALNPGREEPCPLTVCFSAPGCRFVESTLWF